MSNKRIKVGDKIMYSGCWGNEPMKEAVITDIHLATHECEKDGRDVNSCSIKSMRKCVFLFDDNHWAYGIHVKLIN